MKQRQAKKTRGATFCGTTTILNSQQPAWLHTGGVCPATPRLEAHAARQQQATLIPQIPGHSERCHWQAVCLLLMWLVPLSARLWFLPLLAVHCPMPWRFQPRFQPRFHQWLQWQQAELAGQAVTAMQGPQKRYQTKSKRLRRQSRTSAPLPRLPGGAQLAACLCANSVQTQ